MSFLNFKKLLALTICAFLTSGVLAQKRSLEQDSSLNNLIHSESTKTSAIGDLGQVLKIGSGEKKMIFIPGLGFGTETYREFLENYQDEYTIYAITLPGFENTKPLPIEDKQPDFAETPWLNSAIQGIETLIEREKLEKSLLVAHWSVATQIAVRLAIKHPDKFNSVVLISGVAKSHFDSTPEMFSWSLDQREKYVNILSDQWFRTVKRKTWEDNNFMSYDYAVNPMRALFLWRESTKSSLTVQIRYMLEFYSTDITRELENLRVPVLLIQPGFDDSNFYIDPTRPNYMKNLCIDSWKEVKSELITIKKIDDARLFIMYDKPDELKKAIENFTK